jgi:putative redox protein
MKAIARRNGSNFKHAVGVREHTVTIDEARAAGGDDEGPSPQEMLAVSLAACTAVTIEMYASRKGWDVGPLEVECEYSQADRTTPNKFCMVLRLPADLADEQVERLRVIAGRCPVHRTLEGEVMFDESLELS